MTEDKYKVKELLMSHGLVKEGDFILRAGQKSNIYIEKDLIFCNPTLFDEILGHLMCC